MDLDLNDFALFDNPLYRRYKRVKNWHSVNKVSKEDFESCLWSFLLIAAFLLLCFLFSYIQSLLPNWLEWLEVIGVIVLFVLGWAAVLAVIILVSLFIRITYHSSCYFLFKKTTLRRILTRFEKKYLLQEQLITTEIKTALEKNTSSVETAHFLSERQDLRKYVEAAQEKIGSAYPVLKSDIEKAREITTYRYSGSQTDVAIGSTYRSSSKATTARKHTPALKPDPKNSLSTGSIGQKNGKLRPKPSSHIPPSPTAKRKAKPTQPQLTNWKKVNLSRLQIGEQGEELVMQYEQARLKRIGLDHLVEKIEHSSKVIGDGLGYDIKSFDKQGQIIYIEVKTTRGEFWNNLIFTRNELDVMKRIDQQYVLYRVYCLDNEGNGEIAMTRGYGEISKHFSFVPQSFIAKRKPPN